MAEKDLYKVLDVPKTASSEDIKKAYKGLAVKYTEEVSGSNPASQQHFAEVSEAYAILGDEAKRKIYDQSGYVAVNKAFNMQKPRDTFEAFFGDRNPFGAGRGPYKESKSQKSAAPPIPATGYPPGMAPKVAQVVVPPTQQQGLSQAQAHSHHAPATHQPMPASHAHTSQPPAIPVITQQVTCTLEELYNGVAKKFKHSRRVIDKDGKSTVEEKELELKLSRGWKGGTKVTFPGESDDVAGVSSDLHIVIEEAQHPFFIRDGNNLIYKKQVPLVDALTGVSFTVPVLSGRAVEINIQDVIYPGFTKVLPGEGFVSQREPHPAGDLIVVFNVAFPKVLSAPEKEEIRRGVLGTCAY